MNLIDEFPSYPQDENGAVDEPYCNWHLSVFADTGGAYLWDMNGCSIECVDVGAPPSIDQRFVEWCERCETIFIRQRKSGDYSRHHVSEEQADALSKEGLALCADLASHLEGKCKTLDYKDYGTKKMQPQRFVMLNPPSDPANPD